MRRLSGHGLALDASVGLWAQAGAICWIMDLRWGCMDRYHGLIMYLLHEETCRGVPAIVHYRDTQELSTKEDQNLAHSLRRKGTMFLEV